MTYIAKSAFSGCSSFIPSSVERIGESAFLKCSKYYTRIYCEASSKPEGWFYNWNSSNCSVIWITKKKVSS